MLKFFRAIMPHQDSFVTAFAAHAVKGVEAAAVFRSIVAEADPSHPASANAASHQLLLRRIEHEADEMTRSVVRAVHRSFVTPFDRSDILALANSLDDIIDRMKDAGRRILLYQVAATPEMLGMADCISRCCIRLRDGMPLLGSVAANVVGLQSMISDIDGIESEADVLLAKGLDQLFSSTTSSAGAKLMGEKVYDLIEGIVDQCEDVSKLIEGILAEQV